MTAAIRIWPEQAREIEAEAAPIRESVRKMIEAYRPQSQGNGEKIRDIEASPVSEPVREPPPITHRGDSDAQDQSFWRRLVSTAPESKVARATAVFAVRWLLAQTIGYKAHRMQINFANDPITVEDLFATLEPIVRWTIGLAIGATIGGLLKATTVIWVPALARFWLA